jgi:riboflavin biosynthesis pyrimidine reductase
VLSLFVEGGSLVLASFLASGLVDRVIAHVAPVVVGGLGAPLAIGSPPLTDCPPAVAAVDGSPQVRGGDLVWDGGLQWNP